MKCRYVKTIYSNEENEYCVFVYHTDDSQVPSDARDKYYKGNGIRFTAVGNNLPQTGTVDVELTGKWSRGKHGLQLIVEQFKEILPHTIEGIQAYLSAGIIKGIGPKTADLITQCFGRQTFEVLDKEPEKFLQIKGITEKRLEQIVSSYQESREMRDLVAYLTPYKITIQKIRKIHERYGNQSLTILKDRPFALCQISGFGFLTVDQIARATKCQLNDPMRIEGCINYCLDQFMKEGNLYQLKELFIDTIYQQLNAGFLREIVSEQEISACIYKMSQTKNLVVEQGAIYSGRSYKYEKETAEIIANILVKEEAVQMQYDLLIAEAQKELGLELSEKQIASVNMAFSHKLSIITGGPGTGKTTVEMVLMFVYRKLGGLKEMLMAPTGRSSRKMADSTGISAACTMHSGMGLISDDEEFEPELNPLDADFIIMDEQSMVDMHLAWIFFRLLCNGCRVVLIGDVNQLPSVGAGNVFHDLIQCGLIPVTVLDMVYRQGKNSRIAANAYLIQQNRSALAYGADFTFLPAASDQEASDLIHSIYLTVVEEVGVENVQILTPYRKRGAASVNALNQLLRDEINPEVAGRAQLEAAGRIFRKGDKIIQNKNKYGISNGDIGIVRDICVEADGSVTVSLDFGDGKCLDYREEDMEMIEHSYAVTVHKSQGSEYPVVIIPWIPMFYKMLKRNILYTGITRAKTRVYIVGSKRCIAQAIHSPGTDNRNTRLGERIIKCYYNLQSEKEEKSEYEQIAMNL